MGGLSSNIFIDYASIHPAAGLGGAIFTTNDSLNVVNCTVNNNTCSSAASPYDTSASYGDALFQSSSFLTITGSLFATNPALGRSDGISFGIITVSVSPAYGGAIAFSSGSVMIDNCQFIQNTTQGGSNGSGNSQAFGGALYNAAVISIVRTTLSENKVLSSNDNLATVSLSVYGGAIYNLGIATLNRCSIYSNYVQGGLTIFRNSVPWNGGDCFGGAIFNAAQIIAINRTIALNSTISGSGSFGSLFTAPGKNGNVIGGGV